jgi:hypothetical protein
MSKTFKAAVYETHGNPGQILGKGASSGRCRRQIRLGKMVTFRTSLASLNAIEGKKISTSANGSRSPISISPGDGRALLDF